MRGVIRGDKYFLDGKEVTQAEFDQALPDAPKGGKPFESKHCNSWPIYSDALAVHPLDVEEARQDSRAKGVATEFLPDGRAVLTDRGHRKKYMRAYGFHDRKGGYGD